MSSTSRLKFGLPVNWEGMNQFDCRDVYTFWDDFLDSSMSVLAELGRWKSTVSAGPGVAFQDSRHPLSDRRL